MCNGARKRLQGPKKDVFCTHDDAEKSVVSVMMIKKKKGIGVQRATKEVEKAYFEAFECTFESRRT
jgi:hypothetical protein